MRISRIILAIVVLLTSGLMAANEVPELLTLTDNVTNDFELACQHVPSCSSQQIVRDATTPTRWLVTPTLTPDRPDFFFSTATVEEASRPLSTLGVQRK